MKDYLLNTNDTQLAINISRNIFEVENTCGNGSTVYGKLANIIACNSALIDTVAEYLGNYVASKCNDNMLYKQYHDKNHKIASFFNRNVYVDKVKVEEMTFQRQASNVAVNIATQLAIKYGIRLINHALNEKEKMTIFQEIYSLLKFYTFANLDSKLCNQTMAKVELKKIEQSFCLNKKQVNKLKKVDVPNHIYDLDLNTISKLDSSLLDGISYLIYCIHMQKYGENANLDEDILQVYNFLGYNYHLSRELLRENDEAYQTIAMDQLKFLKISRNIFKNVAMELPTINMPDIINKSVEMGAFDPYVRRRENTAKLGKSVSATLFGIFSKEPAVVIQGCATGLSMINVDDNNLEIIRNKLLRNNLESFVVDEIISRSQNIHNGAVNSANR
jgi:hypothetical protein